MAVSLLSQSSINNFKKYRNLAGPFADPIEYFLLGGGGAGAGNTGAGIASQPGGGSGYYESGIVAAGAFTVSIGAGGSAINGTGSSGAPTSFGVISANGGIRGVYASSQAGDGGSGGSGGSQGLLGGTNGSDGNGGTKGIGSGKTLLSWVPTSVSTGFYGGGGTAGTGGSYVAGTSAPAASGGGGQGSAVNNVGQSISGGNGGSGRIMFRYDPKYTIVIGAGLTASTETVSGKKISTITAGSGNISWAV